MKPWEKFKDVMCSTTNSGKYPRLHFTLDCVILLGGIITITLITSLVAAAILLY